MTQDTDFSLGYRYEGKHCLVQKLQVTLKNSLFLHFLGNLSLTKETKQIK